MSLYPESQALKEGDVFSPVTPLHEDRIPDMFFVDSFPRGGMRVLPLQGSSEPQWTSDLPSPGAFTRLAQIELGQFPPSKEEIAQRLALVRAHIFEAFSLQMPLTFNSDASVVMASLPLKDLFSQRIDFSITPQGVTVTLHHFDLNAIPFLDPERFPQWVDFVKNPLNQIPPSRFSTRTILTHEQASQIEAVFAQHGIGSYVTSHAGKNLICGSLQYPSLDMLLMGYLQMGEGPYPQDYKKFPTLQEALSSAVTAAKNLTDTLKALLL
jgi:hypothetical protein